MKPRTEYEIQDKDGKPIKRFIKTRRSLCFWFKRLQPEAVWVVKESANGRKTSWKPTFHTVGE